MSIRLCLFYLFRSVIITSKIDLLFQVCSVIRILPSFRVFPEKFIFIIIGKDIYYHQKKETETMTHAGQIFKAAVVVCRRQIGVSRKKWESGYTAIIRSMRRKKDE
jgi:hypothetical protein